VLPVKQTRLYAAYAPFGLLKGKNGYIAAGAITKNLWEKMVQAMGPNYTWLLTDERTNELKKRNSYAGSPFVHKVIEEWLEAFDHLEEVEKLLRAAGVPAMVVRGFEEVCDAQYIKDREMLVKMKQPFAGEIETYNSPFKMSETPGRIMGYAPLLGEHNREILSSELGYDDETINRLFEEGVIYREPAVDRLSEELEKLNK